MNRYLWLSAIVTGALIVGVGVQGTSQGQTGTKPPADLGPGGATLKLPGGDSADPNSATNPGVPDSIKGLWNPASAAFPKPATGSTRIAEPPSNATEINKDIEIDAKAGNWVIFVMSYSGPKAPEMARKFVAVMRSHYKWNAYVFNYGAEEKRKEYERVQKLRQEQIEALRKAGLDTNLPIRISTIRIDEHTGVLLGGYKTRDEAVAALKKLQDPKITDPQPLIGKVDLDTIVTAKLDPTATNTIRSREWGTKVVNSDIAYVNPFQKAFVAHNPHPGVPKLNNSMSPEEELKFLRHVNKEEPLSLLNCKKPHTLVIKEYHTQYKTVADAKEASNSMKEIKEAHNAWDMLNKGLMRLGKEEEWADQAARNAHNLAEGLRKIKIEAFVLHSKYCSYVTVGNYDSLQDPQLLAMQNVLETLFKSNSYQQLDLLPRAIPMLVPGVRVK